MAEQPQSPGKMHGKGASTKCGISSRPQQRNVITAPDAGEFPDLPPRYFTATQFSKRNKAFTEPSVRNLIFKADPRESTRGTIPGNGLIEAGAIVRIGRKVLIHEGRFFEWVERQGAAGPLAAPAEYRAPRSIHVDARRTTQKRDAQARERTAAQANTAPARPRLRRDARR